MPVPGFLVNTWRRLEKKKQALMARPQPGEQLKILFEDPDILNGGRRTVDIEHLCECTQFSKKEICSLYRGMKKECPLGFIDKDTFVSIIGNFFPLGDADKYATHVFRTFQPDEKGRVGFQCLFELLSILSRTDDPEPKLRWIFSLYDVNGDGVITQDEVAELIEATCCLIKHHECKAGEMSVEQNADVVFKRMNPSCGDYVTWEEFNTACRKNPNLLASLSAFTTTIPVT